MIDYFQANQNKTMYSVMFCHEFWDEDLKYESIDSTDDIYNFDKSVDERTATKTETIAWKFPCKFEHNENGQKDMWVYFMYYNMTLGPSNIFSAIDKPMKKDKELMALKLSLDNSLLHYKAN